MNAPQKFKRFKINTVIKSIIIPLAIVISSALIFYMTFPFIEDALPNGSNYEEQAVQTEAIENE
ncbi:MAG: hypothetical protein ACI4XC_08040 [Eubacterium sp.]